MTRKLHLGVAACFMHADPNRPVFKGRTLLYMEESISHWLMLGGAVPYMLPNDAGDLGPRDLMDGLDGLVLQGGTDVAPPTYDETPLKPEWAGDRVRDIYEIALIKHCIAQGIPILGICRGLQILNAALGGTLYQDIVTQEPEAGLHRDEERYDGVHHKITFNPDSWLGRACGRPGGKVNSVHHQAIRTPAPGMIVEATAPDGIIEAARYQRPGAPFVFGVQWHPEWQNPKDQSLLSAEIPRDLFLRAVESHARGLADKRTTLAARR
jgi:putative glutamine amidotransferase